jgi:hypothetical protein
MSTVAASSSGRQTRWPELDVARAVVVAGLIFFHAALVFDTRDDYYVKNDRTTEVLTPLAAPVVLWAMPLLFLVAGLGVWHSWARRGATGYLRRRVGRLLVPLLTGMILLVPLPVWFRLRADPRYAESYAEFYPRFFQVRWDWSEAPFVLQPAGNGPGFETGHLWFLVLLLCYSLLALPLLWWLGSGRGRWAVQALAVRAAGRPGRTLLPGLLFASVVAGLGLEEDIAAWNVAAYLMFFAAGILLAADGRFRDAVRRDARLGAVLALVGVLITGGTLLVAGDAPGADPLQDHDALSVVGRAAFGAAGWCCTLAIVGALARPPRPDGADQERRPGLRTRAAAYIGPAVLPWYVLHQPVVVAVAFHVVRWPLGPWAKYGIICAASLAITWALYDLGVRRTWLTRRLFGAG